MKWLICFFKILFGIDQKVSTFLKMLISPLEFVISHWIKLFTFFKRVNSFCWKLHSCRQKLFGIFGKVVTESQKPISKSRSFSSNSLISVSRIERMVVKHLRKYSLLAQVNRLFPSTYRNQLVNISKSNTWGTNQDKAKIYLVEAELPNGFHTTYGQQLPFKFELKGSAEIATRDRWLWEHIFANLKDTLTKKTPYGGCNNNIL